MSELEQWETMVAEFRELIEMARELADDLRSSVPGFYDWQDDLIRELQEEADAQPLQKADWKREGF